MGFRLKFYRLVGPSVPGKILLVVDSGPSSGSFVGLEGRIGSELE